MIPTTSTQTNPTSGSSSSTSGSLAGATDQLTNESTFLNLLVAQIKNQDPLNPTDSIQFVGQLVQFSQLEQLIGINQGIHLSGPISRQLQEPTTKLPLRRADDLKEFT